MSMYTLRVAPNRCERGVIVGLWLGAAACLPVGPAPVEGESESSESSGTTGEFVSLIEHELWVQLDAADDPLAEHRPAEVVCGIAGWYIENEIVEIDTNFCNYLALGQPSLAAITEGRLVRLGFYHFDLVAPEPALAHIAMLADGEVLWEQEIEIPGAAMVYELEFEAPFSTPVGAELVFHLHNHGQNTWALQALSAEQ
jgi:hypothetical protein